MDGSFEVDGRPVGTAVVLWKHSAPRKVALKVYSQKAEILVKNVWDVGDGVMHSWHNGAAMIIENQGTIRRYRCNDGHPNDDFDDLIFHIQLPFPQ